MARPKRSISPQRKRIHYTGMAIGIISQEEFDKEKAEVLDDN